MKTFLLVFFAATTLLVGVGVGEAATRGGKPLVVAATTL